MTSPTSYEQFLNRRQQLDSLLQRQLSVLDSLGMKAWKSNVERLEERVLSNNFKVLILGEFNRGKSTFINAMLGKDVLPVKANPTTAIINEVKWGDKPRALLHSYPSGDGSDGKVEEIPVEQIEQYVTIKYNDEELDEDSEMRENPYEKIELFWPLDICRDAVEIIDSPGLNENENRQKITINYLSSVDATIFVIACDFAVSSSETRAIKDILNLGYENTFFICNRINLIKLEEQDEVKRRCRSRLGRLTQGDRYVFFIDALSALEGRLSSNEVQVRQSGLLDIENALKTFLASERGRLKLLRPAYELRVVIGEARRVIPTRKQLLQTDSEVIEARYYKTEKQLSQLEITRRQIDSQFSHFRREANKQVNEAASQFYKHIQGQINVWIKEYEIQQPLGLHEILAKKAQNRVVEEVTSFIAAQLSRESKLWKDLTLQPLLTNLSESLLQDVDERIKLFANSLEQTRLELVSGVSISLEDVEGMKISRLERVSALFGGILLVDPISAAFGVAFGYKQVVKSIIPQLVIFGVTAALSHLNPFILIPILILGGGLQAIMRVEPINKKIRDEVGKGYKQKLELSHWELVNQISSEIDKGLEEVQNTFNEGLGLDIQNIRDQVNSILAEKQHGQTKVEETIHKLTSISGELDTISSELGKLIAEII